MAAGCNYSILISALRKHVDGNIMFTCITFTAHHVYLVHIVDVITFRLECMIAFTLR